MATQVTQTMYVGELTQEMINEGWERTHPIRFLPNNLKPATHFIEVWNNSKHSWHSRQTEIDYIERTLEYCTSVEGVKTVAFFKIRAK